MVAIVFPGQGSQKPGMGRELHDASAAAQQVFDEASEALSLDVRQLCWEMDEGTLRQTQNAQVALFTCGVAAWRALNERARVPVAAMAGHSVGEYAALAAAEIVSLAEGARLVRRRGELMAESGGNRPGTMAAVLGLDHESLQAVCEEASTSESVAVIANDNCPGQLVISGDREAVERAGKLASERGAKRVLPLNVSGAFHSPLMEEPAREMARALRAELFHDGVRGVSVYSNVTAERVDGSSMWPSLLEAQLRSPVRWTESIAAMRRDGIETYIECGAGEVLCGLIRRISKEVATSAVYDAATLDAAASVWQS
jgi:[acyl-carrier-protein] S-malonyltransferase